MNRTLLLILLAADLTAAGLVAQPPTVDLAAADEPGEHLVVAVTLLDPDDHPVAGARVHAYQADDGGRYTRDRAMDEGNARLSAVLTADADGRFVLRTIRPGGYEKPVRLRGAERYIPGHIHLDIEADGFADRHVQVVFADDPRMHDAYWQEWARRGAQPVAEVERTGDGPRCEIVIRLSR